MHRHGAVHVSAAISPLAGNPAPQSLLVDLPKLLDAYLDLRPDTTKPAQRVEFGTSGHRGSSLARSFNVLHVLAIAQGICNYRKSKGIDGQLLTGTAMHVPTQPAVEDLRE